MHTVTIKIPTARANKSALAVCGFHATAPGSCLLDLGNIEISSIGWFRFLMASWVLLKNTNGIIMATIKTAERYKQTYPGINKKFPELSNEIVLAWNGIHRSSKSKFQVEL